MQIVKQAIPYTFAVGDINTSDIEKYMDNAGNILYAEKSDRQMTGHINRMIIDMSYQWNHEWEESETIQVYEANFQNQDIRKKGKDYIVPFKEMTKAVCDEDTQYFEGLSNKYKDIFDNPRLCKACH